jgi:hypothetical protein
MTITIEQAVAKIISVVAKTGKPYQDVGKQLWPKFDLDPVEMKSITFNEVVVSGYNYNVKKVSSELRDRIYEYNLSYKDRENPNILSLGDTMNLIKSLKRIKPGIDPEPAVEIHHPPCKQITYKGFGREELLFLCTKTKSLGLQCYSDNRSFVFYAPPDFYLQNTTLPWNEMVRRNQVLYSALTKRRKLKKVTDKLDRN